MAITSTISDIQIMVNTLQFQRTNLLQTTNEWKENYLYDSIDQLKKYKQTDIQMEHQHKRGDNQRRVVI